jgi:hypothetical protein
VTIAINNVRIFDGHRIGELKTVVIDGDYIAFEHDIDDAVHIEEKAVFSFQD